MQRNSEMESNFPVMDYSVLFDAQKQAEQSFSSSLPQDQQSPLSFTVEQLDQLAELRRVAEQAAVPPHTFFTRA